MQDSDQHLSELQHQLQTLIKEQQDLLQANKKYEEVFSLVTHEFKNLLTSVDGYNRLLHQHFLAENRQDLDEILTASIRIHERLFNIVDQLLKIWMVEKKVLKPDYKLLDFKSDVLQPVEQQLKESLQTNQMTLEKSLPAGKLILMADESMLEIVMRNLLENAVKYGVRQSRVYLTVKVKGQKLEVALRNKVNELTEDFCDTIFQQTQQFKVHDQKGGLGIGLYNVKNLIAVHNGEIQCRRVKQDWIEFRFELPLHL
jgi:two-component system sensor histidine kinase/response regulator